MSAPAFHASNAAIEAAAALLRDRQNVCGDARGCQCEIATDASRHFATAMLIEAERAYSLIHGSTGRDCRDSETIMNVARTHGYDPRLSYPKTVILETADVEIERQDSA